MDKLRYFIYFNFYSDSDMQTIMDIAELFNRKIPIWILPEPNPYFDESLEDFLRKEIKLPPSKQISN